jgi:Nuclease-related domain
MRNVDVDIASTRPAGSTAGRHARAVVRRLRLRTLLALGVLAIATALLGRAFGLHDPLFVASEIALLATMFAISRYVLPLVERHDRGATGEEEVGQLLDGLGGGPWRVIHDASVGRGNVDHIVIGPPGVFTIETKSHPGPVRVSRVHGTTLRQADAERRAVQALADVEVEALLVFSRAWVDRPLASRRGVRVVPARMLAGYLTRRAPSLSVEQIARAHDVLAARLGEAQTRAARRARARPAGFGRRGRRSPTGRRPRSGWRLTE